MPSCSVVMVTYHTGPVLFAAVKSVLRQPSLAELVVVDNGNPVDVLTRLQQMALTEPRLKIITGQVNAGFARACNLGVKRATGDFLLLLAPDCLLPPDALNETMNVLNGPGGAVLAGCTLLDAQGQRLGSWRPDLPKPFAALRDVLGCKRALKKMQQTPPAGQPHEVGALSRHFMCMRRSDYDRQSGMDEGFFLYGADLDFCMRVHKAHGKIVCAPEVKVVRMPGDGGVVRPGSEWQKAKGFIRYVDKHFPRPLPGFLLLARAAIMLRLAAGALLGDLRKRRRREPVLAHSVADKRLMILASGLADLPESKELFGKTVLVTGATGQVGLCVVKRLIAAGAAVLALSRGDGVPFQHEHLRWLKGDLTDHKLHLDGYLIDIVVHCAPLWQLPPVLNLLADAEVKRIIAFGSTSIFARSMSRNLYDKDIVAKLSMAEASIAERCDERGIAWTVFRPTLIYGVGLDANITTLAKFIKRFGWFPVYPPAFGRRQPVHADDLAMGVLQAIYVPAAHNKAYNVSGGEILTYRQMLERIFALLRRKPRIVNSTMLPFALDMLGMALRKKHINGEMARRMNDDLIFFHDEASRDFGFAPRPFLHAGLRDIEGF